MNKNILLGLVVLAIVIIAILVFVTFFVGSSPPAGAGFPPSG